MKLNRLLTAIIISGTVMAAAAGCGAQTEEAVPQEDTVSDNSSEDSSDPYITGGSISPYYTDPNATVSDNSSSDEGAEPDSDENASEPAGIQDTASDNSSSVDTTPVRVDSDIYVANYGNDDNDGSKDSPVASIQQAIDMVSPGHIIYLESGTYCGPNTFNISGTEEQPIIITHDPACNASSVMVAIGKGNTGAIFDMNGQSYIQLIDLRIGNSYGTWIYGVYIPQGSHDIRIEENEFIDLAAPDNGAAYAVLLYGNGGTEDTSIHDIYVYDNEVHNIYTGQGEGLAASGNVDTITFEGNHVYSVSGVGIDLYGGGRTSFSDELDQPRNCVIKGNEVHQCQTYFDESSSGILVDGAKDSTIEDNYVYECPMGIEVSSENYNYDYTTQNILVTGNTVHNNHDAGISIGGYSQNYYGNVENCEVSNNILYNNGYEANDGCNGEIHFEKCKDITVSDNIVRNHNYDYPVIGCGKTSEYVKNVAFTNNLYAYDKPEKIVFRFQGNEYIGLDAWNAFTGGSDVNTASSSGS